MTSRLGWRTPGRPLVFLLEAITDEVSELMVEDDTLDQPNF